MASRPNVIEIRSHSHGPLQRADDMPPRPLSSPRLHVAGDVPPELSPLDAFAAQSRLLAKKLEEGATQGKRLSRLPLQDVETAFTAVRPGFFRSASAQEPRGTKHKPNAPGLGAKMAVEISINRPVSIHPRMSSIPNMDRRGNLSLTQELEDESNRVLTTVNVTNNYTDQAEYAQLRRNDSSQRMIQEIPSFSSHISNIDISLNHHDSQILPNGVAIDTLRLGLPGSTMAQTIYSLKSASLTHAGKDNSPPMLSTQKPNLRKLSSSSGLSDSPVSALTSSQTRPTSACSDVSTTSRLSRPTFNFSRPLSRTELPVRQPRAGNTTENVLLDAVHTPMSMNCEKSSDNRHERLPSVSHSPSESSLSGENTDLVRPSDAGDLQELSMSFGSNKSTPESECIPQGPSNISSKEKTSISFPAIGVSNASGLKAFANIDTLRPPGNIESAEWHVTKGIECHEKGSLQESTYHLRIAARQNHPTGMLLYALACRHGWGMRANQQEGVKWLRRAADMAQLEVADDEDSEKGGKPIDFIEKKTRKAQFALSIYELGVSHFNGWGIEQDRVLALRCFEIAGAWGDGDALAEAGCCYAEGIGCKKDLKRSAKLYRQAEAKGVSMVGNSWIYKSKYQEDDATTTAETTAGTKQIRERSQARSIFSRKRSTK